MTAPVAARGTFPYPHRTVAEVEGEARSAPALRLPTCLICGHRCTTGWACIRCALRGVAA